MSKRVEECRDAPALQVSLQRIADNCAATQCALKYQFGVTDLQIDSAHPKVPLVVGRPLGVPPRGETEISKSSPLFNEGQLTNMCCCLLIHQQLQES